MWDKIGYAIGYGFAEIARNKIVGGIFICVVVILNLLGLFAGEIGATIFITFFFGLPLIFIIGIIARIKDIPIHRQMAKMERMFQELKLCSPGGETPQLVNIQETEYLKIYSYKTLLPVEEWQKKQSHLETYLNTKIAKIVNDENNNNVINILSVKKDLPTSIMWSDEYNNFDKNILILGIDYKGVVFLDLGINPHTFVAGETGSGKSNLLKCMIYQCAMKEHEIKLIDFKRGVSFSSFSDVIDTYYEYEQIDKLLKDLVNETSRRLDIFRENKVENMEAYNQITYNGQLQRIIVFIDELAELMRASDKESNKSITNSLETLTRLSRATGINLIMGLQRPDSTIINGQIKNNVSTRICGHFVDPEPSRIMLGNDKACELSNTRGRFIFKGGYYSEFQAFYITDNVMPSIQNKIYQFNENSKNEEVIEQQIQSSIEEVSTNSSEITFNFDDIEV